MTERSGDPWLGSTYNGFSAATPDEDLPPLAPRRRSAAPLIGAGVAAALVLGVGVGVLTRRDIADEPGLPDPPRAEEVATAAVPIEIAETPPPTATPPAPPLEVLPPDMAKAAAARTVIPRSAPPSPAKPVEVAEAAPAPPAVPASAVVRDAPPLRQGPGFDCGYARSRSERLVCGDAELARLDRRLNRAFDQAVEAGVPYRSLREDQDDWLRIREHAAREAGRGAVASVYRQRIAELSDLARDGSGPY